MTKPLVMGIVNTTPDSFYDGGSYTSLDKALARVKAALAEGADIIDIGGYSTRPNADPVTQEEEYQRTIPLIKAIKQENIKTLISLDSFTPSVIKAALDLGIGIINDASGLADTQAAKLAAEYKAKLVIMHTKGSPKTMTALDNYNDILKEIADFFTEKLSICQNLGVNRENIILDPGLGFAKNKEQNWYILENLNYFESFKLPLLIGASRKRFTDKTLEGSLKAALLAKKHAAIIRVHDIKETVDLLKSETKI